jgi:hypothetical protein
MSAPTRIISGGQTGADRAALDWAIARRIPNGGWCPKNRSAEDGVIEAKFELLETPPTADYVQRTEWNVRDPDGTVVFSIAERLSGGSKKTVELAHKHGKPVLHVCRSAGVMAGSVALQRFVDENGIRVLNVAGPRASKEPDYYCDKQHCGDTELAGFAHSRDTPLD